jgi:hypothetical protein
LLFVLFVLDGGNKFSIAKRAAMKRLRFQWTACALVSGLALTSLAADAAPAMLGTKQMVLSSADGERQVIGTVTFSAAAEGKTAFKIDIDKQFGEFFLAMRPFRCLTGPKQRLCWFPVANEAALISADDLLPLEYALMFLRTKPADLHLNPFNGVYYKLAWTDKGLRGKVHDVDMDPFITPTSLPPARRMRPVLASQLQASDASSHWLPDLDIE